MKGQQLGKDSTELIPKKYVSYVSSIVVRRTRKIRTFKTKPRPSPKEYTTITIGMTR